MKPHYLLFFPFLVALWLWAYYLFPKTTIFILAIIMIVIFSLAIGSKTMDRLHREKKSPHELTPRIR